MSAHGFTSALAPELDAYLAFKEKMGFYGSSRIWYLKRFDAYCTAHGRAAFDRDTVEGWVIPEGPPRVKSVARRATRFLPAWEIALVTAHGDVDAARSSLPLAEHAEGRQGRSAAEGP